MWKSTYEMLEQLLELKEFFTNLVSSLIIAFHEPVQTCYQTLHSS